MNSIKLVSKPTRFGLVRLMSLLSGESVGDNMVTNSELASKVEDQEEENRLLKEKLERL